MYTHNLTNTNEISFNTHLLVIAYYVYIYMLCNIVIFPL